MTCNFISPLSFSNGYNYEVALILSIFGGLFGLDRFYLGYIALGSCIFESKLRLGSLKMWSLGGLGLWYLVDLILLVNNVSVLGVFLLHLIISVSIAHVFFHFRICIQLIDQI